MGANDNQEPCASQLSASGKTGSDEGVLARYLSEEGLIDIVAKQVFRSINGLVEMDELQSAGREGLFDAARRFDEGQGVPFRAYANYRVRGAMIDAVRKASWLPRRTQQRLAAMQAGGLINEASVAQVFMNIDSLAGQHLSQASLDDQLASFVTAAAFAGAADDEAGDVSNEPGANPEEALARHELLELVRDAVGELNEYEACVIRTIYFENRDLEAAAKELGAQKPWACRLHARAIERLTKRLKKLA